MIGVDIDLRKVYAWDSETGMVCRGFNDLLALVLHARHAPHQGKVLVEIASAKDYHQAGGPGAAYNARRWSIFNVAKAAQLDHELPGRVLVAPSSSWTHGYALEARHELAKATAKQKDLRECQAMIWSYRIAPQKWKPLAEYLEQL